MASPTGVVAVCAVSICCCALVLNDVLTLFCLARVCVCMYVCLCHRSNSARDSLFACLTGPNEGLRLQAVIFFTALLQNTGTFFLSIASCWKLCVYVWVLIYLGVSPSVLASGRIVTASFLQSQLDRELLLEQRADDAAPSHVTDNESRQPVSRVPALQTALSLTESLATAQQSASQPPSSAAGHPPPLTDALLCVVLRDPPSSAGGACSGTCMQLLRPDALLFPGAVFILLYIAGYILSLCSHQ